MFKSINILAIETSCDDTSIAVLKNKKILSNLISTQEIHLDYGGVVPELAAREHIKGIIGLIEKALEEAQTTMEEIDFLAVTKEPGLVGSLLVGNNTAETLGRIFKKPVIKINHLIGHVYANFENTEPKFPFISLLVSGGHSQIIEFTNYFESKIIHETEDDAIGECYDKVAKMLNLGYPGGPIIDKLAQKAENKVKYPMPKINLEKNFSFSGLKTHVANIINQANMKNEKIKVNDLLNNFQQAAIEQLLTKLSQSIENKQYKQILICGGVSANSYLREQITLRYSMHNIIMPKISLTTDNAAMIGLAAYYKIVKETNATN